jgi:hypothetical protein
LVAIEESATDLDYHFAVNVPKITPEQEKVKEKQLLTRKK